MAGLTRSRSGTACGAAGWAGRPPGGRPPPGGAAPSPPQPPASGRPVGVDRGKRRALDRRRRLPHADREPDQLHPDVPDRSAVPDGRGAGTADRSGDGPERGPAVKTKHLIVTAVIVTLAVVEFAVMRDVSL